MSVCSICNYERNALNELFAVVCVSLYDDLIDGLGC
jgi:hypothetical protein